MSLSDHLRAGRHRRRRREKAEPTAPATDPIMALKTRAPRRAARPHGQPALRRVALARAAQPARGRGARPRARGRDGPAHDRRARAHSSPRSATTCSATARSSGSSTDPTVTEVMVNGCNSIYVERAGKLYRTDERFDSDARLRQVIDKIVSAVGRRIDESSPMVDARLADGSRVNAVIPPLAIDGPIAHGPEVRQAPPHGRRPDLVRHADARVHRLPVGLRGRPPQHPDQRRYRHRQDDAAQRAVVAHPRDRAHRHHRGRGRAPARPGPPDPARVPPARTWRAAARSRSATSSATHCACGPTASSSVRSAAARRSTCSRP